jgi:hypothetical protein
MAHTWQVVDMEIMTCTHHVFPWHGINDVEITWQTHGRLLHMASMTCTTHYGFLTSQINDYCPFQLQLQLLSHKNHYVATKAIEMSCDGMVLQL